MARPRPLSTGFSRASLSRIIDARYRWAHRVPIRGTMFARRSRTEPVASVRRRACPAINRDPLAIPCASAPGSFPSSFRVPATDETFGRIFAALCHPFRAISFICSLSRARACSPDPGTRSTVAKSAVNFRRLTFFGRINRENGRTGVSMARLRDVARK